MADSLFTDQSPIEAMLDAAEPSMSMMSIISDPVFPPWEPTGNETPQKTIEADKDLIYSPPPPETAGGSIPAAFARFRQYGPDES